MRTFNSCPKAASTGCHRSVAFGTPYQTKPPIEDTTSLKLSVACAERLSQNKTNRSAPWVAAFKVLFAQLTENYVSAQAFSWK